MARKKRVWYPGAMYHVMSRGTRKSAIYKDSTDYVRFLNIICKVHEKIPFRLHAICLMTNHFHLALETQDVELWKIMQKILSLYAENFNHRYDCTGHLFQGRYTACLIEDERYFLEVSRYIHLNPVKAQMVNDPAAYGYSSYGLYVSDRSAYNMSRAEQLIDRMLDTDRVLSAFDGDLRKGYRHFVEGRLSHNDAEQQIQKDIREDEMWLPY